MEKAWQTSYGIAYVVLGLLILLHDTDSHRGANIAWSEQGRVAESAWGSLLTVQGAHPHTPEIGADETHSAPLSKPVQ